MWSIKPDRVNLVSPASPVHRDRYRTNWDRKDWHGSEIQMYCGSPVNKGLKGTVVNRGLPCLYMEGHLKSIYLFQITEFTSETDTIDQLVEKAKESNIIK